jgi:hypothetical protein
LVTFRADVAIFAEGAIGLMDATHLGVTKVVCADVVIIAISESQPFTDSSGALVVGGAGVLVVALAVARTVGAARIGVAGIVCADVAIITFQGSAPLTFAQDAGVHRGAEVIVVAGSGVELVDAT